MAENLFKLLIDSSTDCKIKNITLIIFKIIIDGKNEYYLYKSLEVSDTTGKNLCNLLEKTLLEDKISFSNLVGICTDGAANLIGTYNSLKAHFRTIKPSIFHFTCICHRLHLMFKDALSNIEKYFYQTTQDLASKFSMSYKATNELKELQGYLQEDEIKLLKPSKTRWLSIHTCLDRIGRMYNVVLTFFKKEKSDLYYKLQEPEFLYMLEFSLLYFQKIHEVNKKFQSGTISVTELYTEMILMLKFFVAPFINEGIKNPTDAFYLYLDFNNQALIKSDFKCFESITNELSFNKYATSNIVERLSKKFKDDVISFLQVIVRSIQKILKCEDQQNLTDQYKRSQLIHEVSYLSPFNSNNLQSKSIELLATRFSEYHQEDSSDLQYEFKCSQFDRDPGKYPKLMKLRLVISTLEISNASIERAF